jgi:hypothetical protein
MLVRLTSGSALCQRGAELCVEDLLGFTPLHIAALVQSATLNSSLAGTAARAAPPVLFAVSY